MDNNRLKQRLVGAAVLLSLVVVFLPMLVEENPAPVAHRSAVPERPDWQFAGWDEQAEYVAPELPAEPDPVVIDPALEELDLAGPGTGAEMAAVDSGGAMSGGDGPDSAGDRVEAEVRKGDNLYRIFERHGLGASQVRELLKLGGPTEGLSRLRPGQRFLIGVGDDQRLVYLEYQSRGTRLQVERRGGQLVLLGGGGSTATAAVSRPATQKAPPAQPPREPVQVKSNESVAAWAVQVAAVSELARAKRIVDGLKGKDYRAFVRKDKGGAKLWRVAVGPETRRHAAVALARRIERETEFEGLVVVSYP